MANPDYIAKLKEGKDAWNDWMEEIEKEYRITGEFIDPFDLSGADLSGWDLGGFNLTAANLDGARLTGANLFEVSIGGSFDVRDGKWVPLPCSVDFENADLSYADLSWLDFRKANLKGAKLIGANLEGCDLSGLDLSDIDLQYATLTGANLVGTNLRSAVLSYADLQGTSFFRADLACADLYDTNLTDAYLVEANLQHANLRDAKLHRADITNAILLHVQDDGANYSDAKLGNRVIGKDIEIVEKSPIFRSSYIEQPQLNKAGRATNFLKYLIEREFRDPRVSLGDIKWVLELVGVNEDPWFTMPRTKRITRQQIVDMASFIESTLERHDYLLEFRDKVDSLTPELKKDMSLGELLESFFV